jgi:hypothetical protein
MKLFQIAVFLVLFTGIAFAGEDNRQVIEGNVLKDLDYGFELKRPSAKWVFLKEADIGKLNPNAVAGLYHANRIFTAIVAEEASGITLEDYAKLIMETISIENKKIEYEKKDTFNKINVYRFKATGEIDGVKFTYVITIYPKDNFYFQVISWWLTDFIRKEPKDIVQIHFSFGFTPGVKPKIREVKGPEKDSGAGWRINGPVYINAIHGFKFKLPGKGWRFMGGVELKETDPDATLGIVHEGNGLYVTVITERVGAMTEKEYEKIVLAGFEKENQPKAHKKNKIRVLGKELTQHVFEEISMGTLVMDYLYVINTNNGIGYQITAWWQHCKQKAVLSSLSGLYAGFSWLGKEEKKALCEEMIKLADIQRSVVLGECFRNRTYRNFPFGFSMTLPKGFWIHTIGTDARQQNEDASLLLENMEYGLFSTLIFEESEEFDAVKYHEVVLEAMSPPKGTKTEIIKSNKLEIRSTRLNSNEDGQVFTYHIITASIGKKHFQLVMYGLEGNMERTKALEMEIIKSIRFQKAPIKETAVLADGSFVDYKLGFKITPLDDTWKIKGMTPEPIKGIGSIISVESKKIGLIYVVSIVHAQVDPQSFILNILSSLDMFKAMKLSSEKDVKWLGQPAKLSVFSGFMGLRKFRVKVLTTFIGGTLFCFIEVERGNSISSEKHKSTFKLIK